MEAADLAAGDLRGHGDMNQYDFDLIENQVTELEKLSSLEYVTVFSKKCRSYLELKVFWGLFFVIICFTQLNSLWLSIYVQILASLGLGLFIFWSVTRFHKVFQLLTFDSWVQRWVEKAAREEFLNHEVFATQNRTGILIFVSLLEQKVFVLADKGLKNHSTPGDWAELGKELAGILANTQNHAETFVSALKKISEKYSDKFPPCPKNPNELSNKTQIRN